MEIDDNWRVFGQIPGNSGPYFGFLDVVYHESSLSPYKYESNSSSSWTRETGAAVANVFFATKEVFVQVEEEEGELEALV